MKIDWAKLKKLYTEGAEITLQELADKHNVKAQTLRLRAAKENWTEARKLFFHKVDSLRVEKKSEIMASESAQFDSDSLKLARAGYGLVAEDIKARKPAKDIAVALANFQKVGKLALGETSEQNTAPVINVRVQTEKGKNITEEILTGNLDI